MKNEHAYVLAAAFIFIVGLLFLEFSQRQIEYIGFVHIAQPTTTDCAGETTTQDCTTCCQTVASQSSQVQVLNLLLQVINNKEAEVNALADTDPAKPILLQLVNNKKTSANADLTTATNNERQNCEAQANCAKTTTPSEACNELDDDGNGLVDDGLPTFTHYKDSDSDTYGLASSTKTNCKTTESGYVQRAGDCDDQNPAVNQGATEVCGDNTDNNCDGNTDEGCAPSGETLSFTLVQTDKFGTSLLLNNQPVTKTCTGIPASSTDFVCKTDSTVPFGDNIGYKVTATITGTSLRLENIPAYDANDNLAHTFPRCTELETTGCKINFKQTFVFPSFQTTAILTTPHKVGIKAVPTTTGTGGTTTFTPGPGTNEAWCSVTIPPTLRPTVANQQPKDICTEMIFGRSNNQLLSLGQNDINVLFAAFDDITGDGIPDELDCALPCSTSPNAQFVGSCYNFATNTYGQDGLLETCPTTP